MSVVIVGVVIIGVGGSKSNMVIVGIVSMVLNSIKVVVVGVVGKFLEYVFSMFMSFF